METNRLIIRRFKDSDFDDLYEYITDEEVVKFEPYRINSMDEALNDLNFRVTSDEIYAVELKENHKVIGNIYLGKRDYDTFELGYVFNKSYWHKGYAKEASLLIIENAFNNGAHRIYSECDPLNEASWHLLEALGFVREAYLRKNIYFFKDSEGNPIWKDTYIYSKLK